MIKKINSYLTRWYRWCNWRCNCAIDGTWLGALLGTIVGAMESAILEAVEAAMLGALAIIIFQK